MRTPPGTSEPVVTGWCPVTLDTLADRLPRTDIGRTRIIAIDGRSASGKSTLAEDLRAAIPGSAVVHTDDVAWYFSMFDWTAELSEHIIVPARKRQQVHYRPPGWVAQGRAGAIDVPAYLGTLIVEGVGAGRRELTDLVDALIWVQSDFDTAREKGLARDIEAGVNGDAEHSREFWDQWMGEELPFLEKQQPWSRSVLSVAGVGIRTLELRYVAVTP